MTEKDDSYFVLCTSKVHLTAYDGDVTIGGSVIGIDLETNNRPMLAGSPSEGHAYQINHSLDRHQIVIVGEGMNAFD